MKKKGFTLVELLAVIAILAILVIIALPNVMSLFNEAKKNSFENELKEIFKTAQNQWMTDSMINTQQLYYSRNSMSCGTNCTTKQLSLSGRTQFDYGITIDKAGEVIDFVATDGTYSYQYQGASNTDNKQLKIDKIGSVKSGTETTNDFICRLSDQGKKGATVGWDSTNGFKLTFN